jgi:hypothetical protein
MPSTPNDTRATHGATGQAAITPNDSTDLPVKPCRGIYVGVGGNITCDIGDDTNVQYLNVPQGTVLQVQATRVRATGTTATNLVAMY